MNIDIDPLWENHILFWKKHVEIVRQAYPNKSAALDTLQFIRKMESIRLERTREKTVPIGYSAVDHAITITTEFIARTVEASETKDLLSLCELSQGCLHELMHSISFRKVETVTLDNYTVQSGIHVNKGREGRHTRENELLNELFTNFFVRELMLQNEALATFKTFLKRGTSTRFVENLVIMLDKETVMDAYFEGNMWKFEKALQRRKINPTLFLTLLSSDDQEKITRGVAMIFG